MNFFGPIVPSICQSCACGWGGFFQVIQNVLSIGVSLSVFFAVLLFAYAGFLFVTNPANPENIEKGKETIKNAVIGLIIVLGAWLIVNTVMNALYRGNFGPWNAILTGTPADCLKFSAPSPTVTTTSAGGATGGGGLTTVTPQPTTATTPAPTMSSAALAEAATAAKKYSSQICADARTNGLSASAANQLFGVLGVESDGQAGVVSGKGAVGLMQLEPGTARQLDNTLSGLSDAQVVAKLKDPNYNIALGTRYYAQLYNKFNGNVQYATAAYNAGSGSGFNADGTKQPFAPSSDCPGQYAWQCPINPGGFAETQKYVGNVAGVAADAGAACSY
jgi:hypothetical protein